MPGLCCAAENNSWREKGVRKRKGGQRETVARSVKREVKSAVRPVRADERDGPVAATVGAAMVGEKIERGGKGGKGGSGTGKGLAKPIVCAGGQRRAVIACFQWWKQKPKVV